MRFAILLPFAFFLINLFPFVENCSLAQFATPKIRLASPPPQPVVEPAPEPTPPPEPTPAPEPEPRNVTVNIYQQNNARYYRPGYYPVRRPYVVVPSNYPGWIDPRYYNPYYDRGYGYYIQPWGQPMQFVAPRYVYPYVTPYYNNYRGY